MSLPSVASLVQQLKRLTWRPPVRVVAPENIESLAGLLTLDGVTLENGNAVATPNQTTASERGVWVAKSGAWTRREDFEVGDIVYGGTSFAVTDGSKIGQVFTLSGTGPMRVGTDTLTFVSEVVSEAFDSAIVFDRSKTMVFDGDGTYPCVLAEAPGDLVEGATVKLFIPAGSTDTYDDDDRHVIAAGNFGDSWEAPDPAKHFVVTLAVVNGAIESSGVVVEVIDSTTPTLLSARVYDDAPTVLELEFSIPVHLPASLDAITLPFSVGTARTITGIASGDGTELLKLTLSGAMSYGNAATFTIGAGRTLQSMNGQLIAAGSTEVIFDARLPSLLGRWRSDHRVLSGSDVTSVTDLTGNSQTLTSGATKTTTTTLGTQSRPASTFVAGSYLQYDWAVAQDMTVFTIGMVVDIATLAGGGLGKVLAAFGTAADLAVTQMLIMDFQGADTYARRQSDFTGDIAVASTLPLTPCTIVFAGDGSGAELFVNGVSFGVTTVDADVGNIKRLMFGVMADLAQFPATDMKWAEGFLASTKYDVDDVAVFHDYFTAGYM